MSEPDQLYLQVRISRPQLEKFLDSTPGSAAQFADFMPWLAQKEMVGGPMSAEEVAEIGGGYTARQWVEGWAGETGYPTTNHYDEASQTWTFALIEFAENYHICVDALNTLRRVAEYKDIASEDYLLIYGYFFGGGEVTAALQITQNHSVFVDILPETVIEAADQEIARLAEQISED